ncbi:hypothetical protein Salat_2785100 [Sesamum alatum]|uniref:Uncharacterized protein n=1 Tax=Sesamum alatum TaxID=300844 RepID=A0AAE1XKW1_9LAMI|nr:hypothetical protein Salat_2785100 [Sesamum alatum]
MPNYWLKLAKLSLLWFWSLGEPTGKAKASLCVKRSLIGEDDEATETPLERPCKAKKILLLTPSIEAEKTDFACTEQEEFRKGKHVAIEGFDATDAAHENRL